MPSSNLVARRSSACARIQWSSTWGQTNAYQALNLLAVLVVEAVKQILLVGQCGHKPINGSSRSSVTFRLSPSAFMRHGRLGKPKHSNSFGSISFFDCLSSFLFSSLSCAAHLKECTNSIFQNLQETRNPHGSSVTRDRRASLARQTLTRVS